MITKKYISEKTKIAAYTLMGQNHVENQDSFAFETNQEGCFLAVADGVSTAQYSKKGSQAAVRAVKMLWDEINTRKIDLDHLYEIKVRYVHYWKEIIEKDWNNYATTINFIIVMGKDVLIGQIGDGLLVIDTDGESEILGEEEEFCTAETYALGYAVVKECFTLKKKIFHKHLRAYITTDGIGKEVCKELRGELGEYLEKLIIQTDNTADNEIGVWLKDLSNRNSDDKSLGILMREA